MTKTPNKDGWWYHASDELRLRQIDAGIELGMTMGQVALANGAHLGAVGYTAGAYGQSFPKSAEKSRKGGKRGGWKMSARAAYLRGERVDFWREGGQDRSGAEPLLDEIGG